LVKVRRAELRDIHAIRSIDRDAYLTPWSEKLTIQQVTKPGRLHLVAESDVEGSRGVIVGHAGLLFLHDEAHVSTIATCHKWLRRGVGAALIHALLDAARHQSAAICSLEVRSSNVAAIKLYEAAGFTEVGLRPKYYGDNNEDAVIMTIRL